LKFSPVNFDAATDPAACLILPEYLRTRWPGADVAIRTSQEEMMKAVTALLAACSLFLVASAADAQRRNLRIKPAIQRGITFLKGYGKIAVVDNYRDSKQRLQRRAFFRTKPRTTAGLAGLTTAYTATMATAILGLGYVSYKPLVNLGRRLKGKRPLTFSEMLAGAQYREKHAASTARP
jgi:hypothetical protein